MTPVRSLALLVTTAAAIAAPRPAGAGTSAVRHVPPAEAEAGEPLALRCQVARAWESTLVLRYRPGDGGAWAAAPFQRSADDSWKASVPAAAVRPPGLEYYIESAGEGASTAQFASAALPHRVMVRERGEDLRRVRDLARVGGGRSQLHLAGEYVDYGDRQVGDLQVPDRYYRIDADFSYRLLSYPLKTLRVGYTRLLGATLERETADPGACPTTDCAFDTGFKVGGWFELTFALREGAELDARGMFIATEDGFNVGGRGELRIGVENATHVAFGAEIAADVGSAGFFRLGWYTVPHLPMAATVEVTDFPASRRPTGIRLIYDISYPMPSGLRIGARVGYQARDELIGGASGGLNAALDF